MDKFDLDASLEKFRRDSFRKFIFFIVVGFTAVTVADMLWLMAPVAKDSTDPEKGRSGLYVVVDHLTGCEYLVAAKTASISGGITPRLTREGRHICNGEGEIK